MLTLDLLAKGYRYLEVPIGYRFRSTGRSFVRPLRYLRRVVPAVWRELNPTTAWSRPSADDHDTPTGGAGRSRYENAARKGRFHGRWPWHLFNPRRRGLGGEKPSLLLCSVCS